MKAIWQDLRFAIRLLSRSPAFAALAILTLALGIGANTAIFSVVNGVLLRPLAYRQPGRLYRINEIIPQWHKFAPTLNANLPDFRVWQQRLRSFAGIAIAEHASSDLIGSGEAEEIHGVRCSAGLFDVLGVRPALGRGFLPEEDKSGHGHVVILTDAFWRAHFGGDPSLVGKTITLDGAPYEVVGVLPPGFRFLGSSEPSFFEPLDGARPYERDLIGEFDFFAIGRLALGVTPAQGLAELNVVQAQIAKEAKAGVDLRAAISPLQSDIVGPARRGLIFLLLAVGAVLLIVCVNLANLFLARVPGRLREAAIRSALGASRARLAGQLLAESLLLGLAGGAIGVWLANFGVLWLVHSAPQGIPRIGEVTVDARVVGFALILALVAGALFGIVPAWQISRAGPQDALKSTAVTTSESRRTRRLRHGLIALEVCLSTALLILGGLLTSSLFNVLNVSAGFTPQNALVADLDLPPQSYPQASQRLAFYRQVVAKLRALPGVSDVGWASMRPLQGEGSVTGVSIPSLPQTAAEMPMANYRVVSPDYFAAMGISLREGRIFNENDRGRNVVVVSQSVAERFWPGQNPIGKTCLTYWGPKQPDEVIGVVGDVRVVKLSEPPVMMVYVPDWYGGENLGELGKMGLLRRASIVVRTAGNPAGFSSAVRQAVGRIDSGVPILGLQPMRQVVSASVETRRFELQLEGLFAAFALFLAALGIAGVVAYSVEQRRQELGIRMALGAGSGDVWRMVLRQAISPVVIGLGAGILLAFFAARLMASLLFGVGAFDPGVTAVVAALNLSVAIASSAFPARRALRVDPAQVLRRE